MMVDGVIEAPGGAGFTSCVPDYGRDEAAQKAYAAGNLFAGDSRSANASGNASEGGHGE